MTYVYTLRVFFLQLLGLFIKFPTANPSILSIYSTEHNKYISAKSMPHPAHKRIQRSEYWAGEMVESPLELYSTSKEHPLSTAYQLSLSILSPVFPLTDIEMTFCFFHFLCHVYLIIQLQWTKDVSLDLRVKPPFTEGNYKLTKLHDHNRAKRNQCLSKEQWLTSVILALGRLRQEDPPEFKTSLSCIVRL